MRKNRAHCRWKLLFLLPAMLTIVATVYVPLVYAFYLSLFGGRGRKIEYVGLGNYTKLMSDDMFLSSLVNSLIFTAIIVPCILLLGCLLAYCLWNLKSSAAKRFLSILYFMPSVTSPVAYSLFFKQITYSDGIVSGILKALHVLSDESSLLNSVAGARILISAICVWSWTGFYALILRAAIDNINESAIEAAEMDGASTSKSFRKIILPNISPVLVMVCILSSCSIFQLYTEVALITKGGPGISTYTMALYLYRKAFVYVSEFGYASAIGIAVFFLLILVCLVIIIQKKVYGNEK